jgi:hypothetical protein
MIWERCAVDGIGNFMHFTVPRDIREKTNLNTSRTERIKISREVIDGKRK